MCCLKISFVISGFVQSVLITSTSVSYLHLVVKCQLTMTAGLKIIIWMYLSPAFSNMSYKELSPCMLRGKLLDVLNNFNRFEYCLGSCDFVENCHVISWNAEDNACQRFKLKRNAQELLLSSSNICASKVQKKCTSICIGDQVCHFNGLLATCQCKTGYKENGLGACVDIDECTELTNVCVIDEICLNTIGSHECHCTSGFQRNNENLSCEDIDECLADADNDCDSFENCVNNVGGFDCICKNGFLRNDVNGICEDIDECSVSPGGCSPREDCINLSGSFNCVCKPGFERDTDNNCENIDECVNVQNTCGENEYCLDDVGSYICACKNGFRRINGTCEDIDECIRSPPVCPQLEDCINVNGSFNCTCKVGYLRNADNDCEDLNECTDHCTEGNELCVNTVGSFECHCEQGYQFIDNECEDIDECVNGGLVCNSGEVCQNNDGSYSCRNKI